MAFTVANVPLTGLGVLADWRPALDVPLGAGVAADTFARYGTAVSGPVLPVVLTGTLGLVTRRDGAAGSTATAALGVLGLLIAVNGIRAAVTPPAAGTPRAAGVAGGVFFAGYGAALLATSARAVRAHPRG